MLENYNLDNIKSELIKINNCDLNNDFVAISSEISDEGSCYHSGLIICYQGELFYFHYTGKEVLLENISFPVEEKEIFIKKLNCIHELEVEAFLGHCEKLLQQVSPVYGFIFNNSYYDSNSKQSYLVNASHDITTCVGFCIKVIRGALFNNDEYLNLSDWGIETVQGIDTRLINYFNNSIVNYCSQHNLTPEQLIAIDELKRITPVELICSAFFTILPIHKQSIDLIIERVINDIIELKSAA